MSARPARPVSRGPGGVPHIGEGERLAVLAYLEEWRWQVTSADACADEAFYYALRALIALEHAKEGGPRSVRTRARRLARRLRRLRDRMVAAEAATAF